MRSLLEAVLLLRATELDGSNSARAAVRTESRSCSRQAGQGQGSGNRAPGLKFFSPRDLRPLQASRVFAAHLQQAPQLLHLFAKKNALEPGATALPPFHPLTLPPGHLARQDLGFHPKA